MGATMLMKSMKPSLALRKKMMGQKILFKKALEKMGVAIAQMTKLDLSKNDGLYFKIFSTGNSHEKMCEFHENDFGKILLIFFVFRPTSGKYESTGEILDFENFEGLLGSIVTISEKMK